jgi:hypothetical protein
VLNYDKAIGQAAGRATEQANRNSNNQFRVHKPISRQAPKNAPGIFFCSGTAAPARPKGTALAAVERLLRRHWHIASDDGQMI